MIRRAKETDIPRILDLLLQVELVHHEARPDLFLNGGRKYNENELKEIIADPSRPIFVYQHGGGEVAGYAFCVIKDYTGVPVMRPIKSLYIDDLCVSSGERGRGVGKALFAYVRDYAKNTGCYNLTLNVWEGNGSAKAFYEKMGLVPYKYGMETIL